MIEEMLAQVYDCRERVMAVGHLAVGGQNCYPDGPTGLLTVYQDGKALVEVQITERLAESLARLLVERTQSWTSDEPQG